MRGLYNPRVVVKALVRRIRPRQTGTYGLRQTSKIEDSRGTVVEHSRKRRTLLPTEIAQMVVDYESGISVETLAKVHGIHRQTVLAHLRRQATRVRNSPLDPDECAKAALLYEQGSSLENIGQQIGAAKATVRKAVVSLGGTIRPRPGWPQESEINPTS